MAMLKVFRKKGLLKNMWVKSERIHHGDTEARSRGCMNPERASRLGIHATVGVSSKRRRKTK